MDSQMDLGMMVGYHLALKAYRLYHLTKRNIFVTKDMSINVLEMAIPKHAYK